MTDHLRVAVADDEPLMQQFYRDALPRLGHQVVSVASTGRELISHCQEHRPDLVITDIRMPDMDGLDAAQHVYQDGPIPVVIVSGYYDPEYLERAVQSHVLAYLIKPIKESDLAPAVSIATRRFAEFVTLRHEADSLRQALEDRKVIERAKGLLMKQAHIDEEVAFKRLQKLARSNSKKLVDIAKMIVLAADALEPSDQAKE